MMLATFEHPLYPALILLIAILHPVTCQWALQPETVSDSSGNEADNDSSVTWAKTPPGEAYVASTEYRTGYLTVPVIFAHCFINLVQPNAFPIGIVTGIFDNTFVISRDYKQLLSYGVGIIACIVIGLLFTVLMPIIGCCFCCCRLAGKCGGKRVQTIGSNDCCKKIGYVVCLGVLTTIIGFGAIGMFIANERMTDAVKNYNTSIHNSFNDLNRYLANLGQELRHIGVTNFNFTTEVISRDLEGRGFLVGIPVRTRLEETAGVYAIISQLLGIGNTVGSVGDQLLSLSASIAQLKNDSATLDQSFKDVKSTVERAQRSPGCGVLCQNIDTSGLKMDVDFQSLNISSQVDAIEEVKSADLNGIILKGKATFDNIPSSVVEQTVNLVEDVENSLRNFLTKIEDNLKEVLALPQKVANIKSKVLNVTELAVKYNKARWLACLCMTLVTVLVVVLQGFGICFGVFGYRPSVKPIERTSLSNAGGNCLMTAVGFIKIFSGLMMLANTILFAVGSNAEKLICEAVVHDPQYAVIKKLLDGPGGILCPGCDTYTLSDLLIGNGTIPLKVSETLENCRNNRPAYPTLKLQYLVNLNALTDYKKVTIIGVSTEDYGGTGSPYSRWDRSWELCKTVENCEEIDIEAKVSAMNVDLSGVELLSGEAVDKLNELLVSTQMNYSAFNETLSGNLTSANITDFILVLDAAANDSNDQAKSELLSASNQLKDIQHGIYQTVKQEQDQLLEAINLFYSQSSELALRINDSINSTQIAERKIQTLGPKIIKEEVGLLATRLVTVADGFVNYSVYEIESNVGRCQPIWNVWQSLGDVAVCKYTVDTLNCFWVSIGCALFFMVPSIIFNVKLAKHFRRMESMEQFDSSPIYPQDNVKTQVMPLAEKGKERPKIFASSKITPVG